MSIKQLNGTLFEEMVRAGLVNLQNAEEEVNRLNVFPVADGDTGTNMCLTLGHGIRMAKSSVSAANYLRDLSGGMLLGARGNSGVILSQLFKGIYLELSGCGIVNPGELRDALIRGYKTAYLSVVKPVEGTILTVAREGIERIRSQITRGITIETVMAMYLAEMRRSLAATPELLPVLKESGVIDSGAYGYILIVEGMLKALYGEKVIPSEHAARQEAEPHCPLGDFDENSPFTDGYCTEFILQLMNGEKYDRSFRKDTFVSTLLSLGNSLVVVQDGRRVKVHVHTFTPALVIAEAQKYGEFISFKLENMQLQHNEVMKAKAQERPRQKAAVIAAVNGKGLAEIFSGLGCGKVILCENSMNASTEDFVDALYEMNAERAVILPNNKNVLLAAEQAAKLYTDGAVEVLPTESVAEGYMALAMDVPDSEDIDYRIAQMKSGIRSTVTIEETVAAKAYSANDISCKAGDVLVLRGGRIVNVSDNWLDGILAGLAGTPDIDDLESCIVFRGEGISAELDDVLIDAISARCPMMDVTVLDGGQKIYHRILAIS